jgi:hypothetical protein
MRLRKLRNAQFHAVTTLELHDEINVLSGQIALRKTKLP